VALLHAEHSLHTPYHNPRPIRSAEAASLLSLLALPDPRRVYERRQGQVERSGWCTQGRRAATAFRGWPGARGVFLAFSSLHTTMLWLIDSRSPGTCPGPPPFGGDSFT
jgi:hypothetical protein